ncbi:MAG: hypothetical protein ACO2ZE_12890 [Pseudohongiellaceae bacterium]|nr:hypothetical protein [Rhodobacterales bacterium LSUCC0387]
MSGFYPEDVYLDSAQIRELSANEDLRLDENALVYATRILPDGTYQPTISHRQDGYGPLLINVIYDASAGAGVAVLNQRILVIESSNRSEGVSLFISYPRDNAIKPN